MTVIQDEVKVVGKASLMTFGLWHGKIVVERRGIADRKWRRLVEYVSPRGRERNFTVTFSEDDARFYRVLSPVLHRPGKLFSLKFFEGADA